MKYAINFSDAAAVGEETFGEFGTLPTFGKGWGAWVLGSSLNADPDIDVWNGLTATITGTPGTFALAVDGSNKIVLPSNARAIFDVNNEAAIFALLKYTDQQQSLFGENHNPTSNASMGILRTGTSGKLSAFSRDSSASANGTVDISTPTAYRLVVANFTLTSAQCYSQRTGVGRNTNGVVTKASGDVGSATLPLQCGGNTTYGSGSAATVAALGAYTNVLTTDEIQTLFEACVELAEFAGETL